jgi:hypothetical protein
MTRTWKQRVDPIQRRVRSARLRHLAVLVVEQTAPLVSAVLFIRIVQVRSGVLVEPSYIWRWAAATSTVVLLGAVIFRVLRRIHTPYEIAQILDSGSGLRDAFSTAWFLLAHPGYATGFNAAAHVAHANGLIYQIRPGKLFPIPTKSLLTVAALCGLLAYTGSAIPHAPTPGKSPTSTRLSPGVSVTPATMSGISNRGVDSSGENPQSEIEREPAGRGSQAYEPGFTAVSQKDQSGPASDLTQSSGSRKESDHSPDAHAIAENPSVSAPTEAASHPAADPNTGLNGHAMASVTDPGVRQSDAHRDSGLGTQTTPSLVLSTESRLSQLLAPITRLLTPGGQSPHPAKTEAASPPVKTRPEAAPHPGSEQGSAPTPGSLHTQGSLPDMTEYSSSDASNQQASNKAPTNFPPSMGGSRTEAAPNARQDFPASGNLIDLVEPNPSGDTGHTRVEAVQGGGSLLRSHSVDPDHHSDSGREILRDEVPLGYQSSIQTYLERTRVNMQIRSRSKQQVQR